MIFIFEIIFWSCIGMIFYIYLGYPLAIFFLSKIIKKPVSKQFYEPMVTLLIAAYNEEKQIGGTIDNKLRLEYPQDKLEIIVISDESTDQTDTIIKSFNGQNVKFLRQKRRAGKTSALNMAIPHAKGEILVFSDANSMYAPDALKHIVANFHDPEVGYVTGKMIYINSDGTLVGDGCSKYMKYENFLRKMETKIGSVVGVDGGIDAMRKKIYTQLNADQLPDFVQPLNVIEQGYRVVYESSACLKEDSLQQTADEYKMRVRVTLRALWALKDMKHLFLGSGPGLYSWQLWSHKILRYFCFIFIFLALITNVYLATKSSFYIAILFFQISCYMGAVVSPMLARCNLDFIIFRLLYYFALLNTTSLHAAIKFIKGEKQAVWSPRKG